MTPCSILSNLTVVAICFLFFATIKCDCQTCVDLPIYSCKICYKSCEQNKTLSDCSHTYCSSYSIHHNGTQTCNSYNTQSLTQGECFKTCCGSQQNYFSLQQLNRCQSKSKENSTIIIAVVCSFLGALIVIFIICFLYHRGCPGCSPHCFTSLVECLGGCCKCFGECLSFLLTCKCLIKDKEPSISIQQSINNSNMELAVKSTNIKWQNDIQIQMIINDTSNVCSVCLSNNVNTITRCHHGYHYDCLLLWFNKNPSCPSCISDNINEVRFYCRCCSIKYIKLDLKIHKQLEKILKEIKGPKCTGCL